MKTLVGLAGAVIFFGTTMSGTAEPTPWEAYLGSPTPTNAAKVAELSYSSPETEYQEEVDLNLLAVQVQSADREAIRLAFRLLQKADGNHAEMLDIMLGRIIRTSPTVFLEELNAAHVPHDRLDGLVGNFGPEYVDREVAQLYEMHQRISALRSVKHAHLKLLREACVKELQ